MRPPRICNLIVDENSIDIIDEGKVLQELLSRLSAIKQNEKIKFYFDFLIYIILFKSCNSHFPR